LLAMRQVHLDTDLLGFVINAARDKRVLDIGVVEHAARYVDREGWRHGHIHRVAARCVGVDILEPLVQELNLRGFDVHCVDATSEADLGERFDFIFIGDVVEHVDNPVALLRFAKRHLADGGRILVPTMALELGRRAGLSLRAYHLIKPISGFRRAWKQLAWRYTPVEYSFPDFIFEYSLPQPEVD
jgi:2-polyprenyl-3-methyl-5-hydroxy-6-metoxy-1,4-benzoquinol methylase